MQIIMITVIVGVVMTIMAASPANGGSLDIKIVLQGDTGLYLCRLTVTMAWILSRWRKLVQMSSSCLKSSKMLMALTPFWQTMANISAGFFEEESKQLKQQNLASMYTPSSMSSTMTM